MSKLKVNPITGKLDEVRSDQDILDVAPSSTSELTNDSNFQTDTDVSTAIAPKANTADLSTVATSGNHSDLTLDGGTNPHNTTSSDVGLGNVDDTSDLNKPISIAQQNALDLKADSIDLEKTFETPASAGALLGGNSISYVQNFTVEGISTFTLPTSGNITGDVKTVIRVVNNHRDVLNQLLGVEISYSGMTYDKLKVIGDTVHFIWDGSSWSVFSEELGARKVTKLLPSDVTTSTTDISSLRVTGLTIGRSYSVNSQIYITSAAASGASMYVKHDGVSVHRHNFDSGGANFAGLSSGNVSYFIATTTSLTVDLSLGTSTTIVGNNSTEGTFLEITELPYSIVEVGNF